MLKNPVTSKFRWIAGAVLMLATAASHAVDFKSVGAAPVILYDAPSVKGGKLYVAPRGMPLEVVLSYGEWVKVRDASGEMAWTEAKGLSPKRNVVARTANLKVRASPDDNASPVLLVDKGVLLEMSEQPTSGWVKVRHKDGQTGYVKTSEVWGL
ncbi:MULTISPECIES: SH3 domain-containing protein [unclassified Janthinobacterium]|uniref:SH3 domain-containing protein n=1 Tax=unclassified Janthinobacterium TaxID=2610881 RepID=UPI00160D676C|nr:MULTISPECIES: SH3 domain-containing protein [unclassified Janthinobacterium]MBB5370295.1 SH3-like domain-containing protein [Janthinobacterium sp. K2C7]MBB5383101.1 SH3-like domain-containing protein [Janthinobacterium sp. K2Li3]MBB5388420.1 SH3-like domain-containing protein [Janthinobacterium sp. K2E3]